MFELRQDVHCVMQGCDMIVSQVHDVEVKTACQWHYTILDKWRNICTIHSEIMPQ